ncbi:MAG: hypothetical protein D6726_09420 [Nitrospirae bacterium]|nr:MAG: hypothetical protein D6726_09420 [Nitrospirota bacterium]
MFREFSKIIGELLKRFDLTGFEPSKGFSSANGLKKSVFAFLIVLSGEDSPLYEDALRYLKDGDATEVLSERRVREFFLKGLRQIQDEVTELCIKDRSFSDKLKTSGSYLSSLSNKEFVSFVRDILFPEGIIGDDKDAVISLLRKKRAVSIKRLNPDPIVNPAREIIFTANALLTIPPEEYRLNKCGLGDKLLCRIGDVMKEEQIYWYDHPVEIGVAPERNEILYGLRGLSDMVRFEKSRGVINRKDRLTTLLSVSVTHKGLHDCSREYIEEEIRRYGQIKDMDIYIFTEADTERMLAELVFPVIDKYGDPAGKEKVKRVFGVDGEYGRHYSFLKAVTAFWSVFIDTDKRGTFKIDLDQVFPEEALVRETGLSALEHFKSPLWGGEGVDSNGERVYLGLIAGALVNEKDLRDTLFVPDVPFPDGIKYPDEIIFQSTLPQAVSTVAEMMTRYDEGGEYDGRTSCIQRVHVTGGTTGVLIDALRRYRPFTPSFIGRAEDQAYIMSVLYEDEFPLLRYLHKAGLIMRHDKEAFAADAIKRAETGKTVGDYVRMILFSFYAGALPWRMEKTKEALSPFTGCFITQLPFTLAIVRLALRSAGHYVRGDIKKAEQLITIGARRIGNLLDEIEKDPMFIKKAYTDEKEGWDIYYDAIDEAERGLAKNDPFFMNLREKAEAFSKGICISC